MTSQASSASSTKQTRKKKKETRGTTEFREVAGFITGKLGRRYAVGDIWITSVGSSSSVDMGEMFDTVDSREALYGDLIGFYHTHPPGCPTISGRDVDTMEQMVDWFGKTLLCAIECEEIVNVWIFRHRKSGWKHSRSCELLDKGPLVVKL